MKNKTVFKIAFISLLIFIVIGTYFWFIYFRDYSTEKTLQKVRFELVNNGGINYINAVPNDLEANIPIYNFQVKNNVNENIKYKVILKDVSPSEANDGCTDDILFKREELNYELKKEGITIKSGVLASLDNSVLTTDDAKAHSTNSYALKIWLNENSSDNLLRHYHYIVNVEEIK